MNHPFNTRSFFPLDGERRPVGYGFELVRGYFQSVRPAIGKLLVNVDISTGLFIKSGRLIDVALDFLGQSNDVSALQPEKLGQRGRVKLQSFLSGLRVSISPGNRTVTIARLSQVSAANFVFPLREGGQISVTDYYRRQNNQVMYPGLLCIQVSLSTCPHDLFLKFSTDSRRCSDSL
jgi:eukaryotic translation initiation factor 2C